MSRPTEQEIEARAAQMFAERWPEKSWAGQQANRSYWRRQARKALVWRA